MPEVQFNPRYVIPSTRNPDPFWLRDVILNPLRPGREFGEATLEYSVADRTVTMILIHDPVLGYYLKYDPRGEEWLSLGDASRLGEVVCPDDWEASAGLFIPPEQAWLVIDAFCRSGERSTAIQWIRPSEMPADGNW